MLPDEMTPEDLPILWIDDAKADLVLAQSELLPGGKYSHLCFHAQQAAKKALKAVLFQCKIDFPLTHNLQLLIDHLPAIYPRTSKLIEATSLNVYAVEKRYPNKFIHVEKPDWEQAVIHAENVVQFAEAAIPRQ